MHIHPVDRVGYAPPFHGRFSNGRIEGFLPARALEPQEMSERSPVNFVSLIAREMGRLHGLSVTTAGPPGEAEIWRVLPKWLELAKGEWNWRRARCGFCRLTASCVRVSVYRRRHRLWYM